MSVKRVTRKDGKVSWTAVVDGPRHPDGRRRQVRKTFPTKKQAESWAAKQKVSMDEGTTVVRETTTVADYLDEWLAGKRDVRDVTRNGYRDALKPVSQRYGHLPLQKLTKRHLDEMCEERLAAGRSARTVNVTMIVLGQALDAAVRERRLAYNPARLVERVKESRKAADDPLKRAYTAQQMATFLDTAEGERLAACWHLTALGLRRSEVLGLRWERVNLDARTVTIDTTRVLTSRGHVVVSEDTKSDRGRRTLDVGPDVAGMLKRLKARQAEEALAFGPGYNPGGWVAVDEAGRPVRPETYSDDWRRLVKEAGLPARRLHDARHTSVSIMLKAGIPVTEVARWHGHSVATMLATYAHSLEDTGSSASAALRGALDEARAKIM